MLGRLAGESNVSACSSCKSDAPAAERRQWFGARTPLVRLGVILALIGSSWLLHWLRLGPDVLASSLAVAAAAVGVWPLALNAVEGLFRRRLGVDALVTLAVLASVGVEEYRAAGMVAFIMLLGEYLERLATSRARQAISSLMDLSPKWAVVLRDGAEMCLPAREVVVGDRLLVRPGEQIAADGMIVAGEATVNEAPITGESIPRDKGVGDSVFGGTVLEDGSIDVEATGVGEDTAIAKVARLVAAAERNRAPAERIADRFAMWFVPAVVVLAISVFLLTGSARQGIAVLVVACPCALVLATPTAVVAAIARAAREGILIKGGAHLEMAGRVCAVALDKTGTVTTGRPVVVRVSALDGYDGGEVLGLAAAAERRSEHPLAKAIVAAAEASGIAVPEAEGFASARGLGVVATVNGKQIVVGSRRQLESHSLQPAAATTAEAAGAEPQGQTAVFVGVNDSVVGMILVADAVRQQSRRAIEELGRLGMHEVAMLTGDNEGVARAVADQVGIRDVRAGSLPEDKLKHIARTAANGHKVAMVGDGINDAPALAAADLGIALGAAGSDAAIEAADIALMADDLTKLPDTFRLGRRSLKIIRQNIAFSLVFNAFAVGLVALGVVGIVGAAVLHQVSSLAVILNALRLIRRTREVKGAA